MKYNDVGGTMSEKGVFVNSAVDMFEEKLKQYITSHAVVCEHLHFEVSCHSVAEAAVAAHASAEDFVKNICLIDRAGHIVVAILKGENRLDRKKLEAVCATGKLRFATAEEVLTKSGYPIGGVPSFGYTARFCIDEKVLKKELVYSGGGSAQALVKIAPKEIVRLTHAQVASLCLK